MSKSNLYIDFHVLQTVPPSCINRDDTGSPKTALFGGVTRARVSSQCWKRAIRLMFKNELSESQIGVRTKGFIELIIQKMLIINKTISYEEAEKRAIEGLSKIFAPKKNDKKPTSKY